MLILQSTGDSLASGRRRGRASGAGSPTIQCFCWPVIGFPPSFSLILFPLNFYILPPSKSCILATWKCEAALTLRRAEAADRHAPTSRISAPTLVRQTPIHAPARWSSPPAFLSFQSLFYNICLQFFYLSKVLLQLFYFRISLYIFPWFFLFQIFDTNACLQKFLPRYFCVLLSHKSWFQFFVQNVFLKILFPNFYSNFFFPFSAFIIFLDKKYWFKLLLFSFFLEFFSFSQSFVCLIFFLEFLLCHKFWFQFLSKIYSESFWTKKIDSNFLLYLFFII